MPKSTRDADLAKLLAEVRSLQAELEVLKKNPIIRDAIGAGRDLPPDYAVLVRPGPDFGERVRDLPPDYAVLVRPGPDFGERMRDLPPDYAVLVRPAPFDERVLPANRVRAARGGAAGRVKAKARAAKAKAPAAKTKAKAKNRR
jgi:hypothetical protein